MDKNTEMDLNKNVLIWKLYFDGNKSSEGVSCSYLFIDENDKKQEVTIILPAQTTVPEAEYNGLIKGLEYLIEKNYNLNLVKLKIYGDSQLVINQILGKYECQKPQLRILRSNVRTLLDKFKNWTLTWVPREQNMVR